jgi:hypothetical protein
LIMLQAPGSGAWVVAAGREGGMSVWGRQAAMKGQLQPIQQWHLLHVINPSGSTVHEPRRFLDQAPVSAYAINRQL